MERFLRYSVIANFRDAKKMFHIKQEVFAKYYKIPFSEPSRKFCGILRKNKQKKCAHLQFRETGKNCWKRANLMFFSTCPCQNMYSQIESQDFRLEGIPDRKT